MVTTFPQAPPHHCLLGSAFPSCMAPAYHHVPSVSVCLQHVKLLKNLSIILDPIFQVKSSKLQMESFFFFFSLEITESWGNFIVSHIKKRTSDVTQHLLNMNMRKEQLTQSPIEQRREGICFALRWQILEWESVCSSICPVSTIGNHVRRCRWKKATKLVEHLQCAELRKVLQRTDSLKKLGRGDLGQGKD